MRTAKIFQTPHVEVRVHVSEEMEKDLRGCRKMFENDSKDCNQCSWRDVVWLGISFCGLVAAQDRILTRKEQP